jgi:hypothetical protein
MKLTETHLRKIIREEREHMKYVQHYELSPHEQGWNAFVLYGDSSSRITDHDDYNPYDSREWPESEKWSEFQRGWEGAMEARATDLIEP